MTHYTYHGKADASKHIIYLHGGGYVMGDRHDLPLELLNLLSHNEHALIALDYPLAPQSKVSDTVTFCENMINTLIETYAIQNLTLMGRSSGGNIILNIDPINIHCSIQKLILFYTYASSDTTWMSDPINDLEIPINKKLVEEIGAISEPQFQRSLQSAYSYYYSLRKLGIWPQTIGIHQAPILLDPSIPTFIALSIFDPDVPYHCAKVLRNTFTHSQMYTSTARKHAIDHEANDLAQILELLETFIAL